MTGNTAESDMMCLSNRIGCEEFPVTAGSSVTADSGES